jgi:uncharacterized protein YrzB (UPF0473 family)
METKAILKTSDIHSKEIRIIDLTGTENLFANLYSLSENVNKNTELFCNTAQTMAYIIKLISLTNKDMETLLRKRYNV